ncbi:MAG: glycosyltransferase [Sneathiella sp.]|mgnify:CR=1 FL=1|jgi:hypothetical protein|uniref:hypothetical protein n=1 Tax=Sneathiella sp. TaxID=1964365 RepID=UPI000C575E24|nr:hypothetical protein [Sneathiella sp.]MAZ04220.1 glycosyltransferase [Sneathiella sp.]
MYTIYIGYDPKEDMAYQVLKFSLERIASKPVRVVPIKRDVVQRMGLYRREHTVMDGQNYDVIDGRPFSTEFSFTRFLVPFLNMFEGKALYMDCDMYMRTDVIELFEACDLDYYPLWCVHHEYEPISGSKMNNKIQEPYRRKNWSSLMMFNCSHEANKTLTIDDVNTRSGRWLHGFEWLSDKEGDIGKIDEDWNWLDGHSDESLEAKCVHFTTGGPWFEDWRCRGKVDGKYAVEWTNDVRWLQANGMVDAEIDYLIKAKKESNPSSIVFME